MREAALLAAEEVQEVLPDVPGGNAFRVGAVLDLVLSQATSPSSTSPRPRLDLPSPACSGLPTASMPVGLRASPRGIAIAYCQRVLVLPPSCAEHPEGQGGGLPKCHPAGAGRCRS